MNFQLKVVSALILALLLSPDTRADTPTNVQMEINFLLGYIEGSGCEFYRNGSWHASNEAQEHFREKYKWLMARNQINTTEDFIEKAATKSSLSGLSYSVLCKSGQKISSNQWLHTELVRLRTF